MVADRMTASIQFPEHRRRRPQRRILFVIGSLDRGGTESQLAILAAQLLKRGWSVAVFVLDKSGSLVLTLEGNGIHVFDGRYRFGTQLPLIKLLLLAKCQWRLMRCLLGYRPSVVHAFLPLTNFMGSLAAQLNRVPLIVTSRRGLGKHQDRHPYLRWLDWTANAFSHVVTANSHAVAADVERRDGYPASQIAVIPNGLDFDLFAKAVSRREEVRRILGLCAGDIAIANVANLIPYKGHVELLEAFAVLVKEGRQLRLFLIGEDRGVGQSLSDAAKKAGVCDKVHFLGGRSDVPELLSAMDLGVMASHEEGFSNAVLEKLASGLPVVATDVGGNPEALEGMPNCEIVRPMDPADLARGMRSILSCLDVAREDAQTRRRLVRERYSVEAMTDFYERLYLSRVTSGDH